MSGQRITTNREREGWMVGDDLYLTERDAEVARDTRARIRNGDTDPIRKVRLLVQRAPVETETVPHTTRSTGANSCHCDDGCEDGFTRDSYVVPFKNPDPAWQPGGKRSCPFPSTGFSLPRWGANQLAICLNAELLERDPGNVWYVVARVRKNGFWVVQVQLPFQYAPPSPCSTPIPDGLAPMTNCEARRLMLALNGEAAERPGVVEDWHLHVKTISEIDDGDLYPVNPDSWHFACLQPQFEDVTFSVTNAGDEDAAREQIRRALAGIPR